MSTKKTLKKLKDPKRKFGQAACDDAILLDYTFKLVKDVGLELYTSTSKLPLGEYGELRPPEYHLRPMVQFGLDMGSISGKMVGHFEYILRADKDYDPLHRSWDDISDAFKHAEIMSARLSV